MMRGACLIALLALASGASAATKQRYVISEFGAVGDGQKLNTTAIQAVINRCAWSGGGVVVVPKGTFLSGALFFKQGCDLQIEKEGVLKGSTNNEDYPTVFTRWEGIERDWTSAFLNFENMTNVELSGEGTIDGSGDQTAKMQGGPRRGRPRLICFTNCKRVRVASLNLKNQQVWCLHVLYSQDVLIEGLTIRAEHYIPSSDGIDIDSSRRVRIRKCDIDVNDDCISIKAGKDEDGLRIHRPSENILIENVRFAYGHGGAAMGSEVSGGIRNVTIRDCTAEAGQWAPVRFKSQPSRGGIVENITYKNIKIIDARMAFDFNLEWRMVPPIAPAAKVLTKVRNVKVINVSGKVASGGTIHGLKDSPIEGLTFRNCVLEADKPLVVENVRKVDFSGLKITVKSGEPIVRTNAR